MPFYMSLMFFDLLADSCIFVWLKILLLLLSFTHAWGSHVSFSFNMWCFFFLLPPTPGLVVEPPAHPHGTPTVARPGILLATRCSWWWWRAPPPHGKSGGAPGGTRRGEARVTTPCRAQAREGWARGDAAGVELGWHGELGVVSSGTGRSRRERMRLKKKLTCGAHTSMSEGSRAVGIFLAIRNMHTLRGSASGSKNIKDG